jgi:hypothetical protein
MSARGGMGMGLMSSCLEGPGARPHRLRKVRRAQTAPYDQTDAEDGRPEGGRIWIRSPRGLGSASG